MNPWLKMATVLIIALGGFCGGIAISRNHYSTIIAKMEKNASDERLAAEKQLNSAITDNDKLKTDLEGKKHEAETVIDLLTNTKPNRVRLPMPTCTSVQTNPASGSESAVQPARLLFEETERVLGDDRQRTQGIITEAERELNECRTVKEWAGSLK